MKPESSDKYLNFDIDTESGTISIEVQNADGEVIFQKADIDSSDSFEVDVTGKIQVIIKANKHKGTTSPLGVQTA